MRSGSRSRRASEHISRTADQRPSLRVLLQARQLLWSFSVPSLDRAVNASRRRSAIGENASAFRARPSHPLHPKRARRRSRHIAAAARYADRMAALDPEHVRRRVSSVDTSTSRAGMVREAIAALTHARSSRQTAPTRWRCSRTPTSSPVTTSEPVCGDQAIALDPMTPLFQSMPGFCAYVTSQSETAISITGDSSRLDALNPMARFALPYMLAEAGQLRELRASPIRQDDVGGNGRRSADVRARVCV